MATRSEIVQFLGEFRVAVQMGQYFMVPREKNLKAIEILGITPNDARKTICSLDVCHYSAGPEPDDDDPSQVNVWKFGCQVEKVEVYIKLRLAPGPKKNQFVAKVLSFHPAERRINYPLIDGASHD